MTDVNLQELRKLAEGAQAEIFAWGEADVLRLLRPGVPPELIEREATAMRAAAAAGLPVPAVGEIVEVDGRRGLVMERVDGPDLFALAGRRPWKILDVAHTTGALHARLHEVVAPAEAPALRETIRGRLLTSPFVPAEARDIGLEHLERLPDGDRICHGDFHPGNILAAGSRMAIIDWGSATRGDPAADFAWTMVLGRAAVRPPGMSGTAWALFTAGRKILVPQMERTYRKRTTADLANLERWIAVRAAERFDDRFVGEEDALWRLVRGVRRPR